VTQDEQGLLIVDQHAQHERAMFEYLLARVTGGGEGAAAALESQEMLIPVIVPASPRQIERLPELDGLLSRIGVRAEAMGPLSVGVRAFPTFLFGRAVDPGEFVRELLEKSEEDGFAPGGEETLHEVLDMMACKAAIKAGDHMSDGELRDLLHLREEIERASNCPHGRPTSIRLTIRELEKRFGRV
jgi:DNA mismatch repair protein MutL